MTFLHSLRAATFGTALACAAAIVGGALVSSPPALAIPIRGVTSWNAGSDVGGPRRPGAFRNSAGPGSGASVAKGRPTGTTAPSPSSEWLLGMKR